MNADRRGVAASSMETRMMTMRSSLWFIPVLCVLAGVAVSIGTIAIDR